MVGGKIPARGRGAPYSSAAGEYGRLQSAVKAACRAAVPGPSPVRTPRAGFSSLQDEERRHRRRLWRQRRLAEHAGHTRSALHATVQRRARRSAPPIAKGTGRMIAMKATYNRAVGFTVAGWLGGMLLALPA